MIIRISYNADEMEAFFKIREPFATFRSRLCEFHSMREHWMSFVTTGQPVSNNGITWEVRFPLPPPKKS